MLVITDKNFEEKILKSKTPALVDFWASWCSPCLILGPIIEDIDKEFGDKILIGKVNVDENHILSSQYKIDAIPSIFIFRDGKVIDKIIGVRTKEELIEKIQAAIRD